MHVKINMLAYAIYPLYPLNLQYVHHYDIDSTCTELPACRRIWEVGNLESALHAYKGKLLFGNKVMGKKGNVIALKYYNNIF